MAGTEVQLRGFAELKQLLDDLPAKIRGKAMQAGIREAGNILRDESKKLVYSTSGLHRRSAFLRESIKTRKGIGDLTTVQQFTYVDNKAYYGYFWEKGFMRWSRGSNKRKAGVKIKGRKKGKKLRSEPARPFMRPAFENSRERIIAQMAAKIKKVALKERSKVL